MKEVNHGTAWKFGSNLDVDMDIFPFQYVLEYSSGVPLEKLACHLMEPVDPEFGKSVRNGDFLVAGQNFGTGKAHPEAAGALKILGLSAIIADSVTPGFFKIAIYYAIPVLIGEGLSEKINQGDELEVNIINGEIRNHNNGELFHANPSVPPGHPLYPIMEAGGR